MRVAAPGGEAERELALWELTVPLLAEVTAVLARAQAGGVGVNGESDQEDSAWQETWLRRARGDTQAHILEHHRRGHDRVRGDWPVTVRT
jgi:hypothetical protein